MEVVTIGGNVRLALLRLKPSASLLASPAATGVNRTVIAVHATGFCKEVWLPVVEELRKQHDASEFVLYDARNHGDSALLNHHLLDYSSTAVVEWTTFAQDLIELVHHEKKGKPLSHQIVGFGHSGGGAACVVAQIKNSKPRLFDAILAIEPVLFKFPEGSTVDTPLAVGARKRKPHFKSRQEAYDSFHSKSLFKTWDARALRHYAFDGLRDRTDAERKESQPDMAVTLKCPPLQEAASFNGSFSISSMISRMGEIDAPCLLIQGGQSDMYAMMEAGLDEDKDETYLKSLASMAPRYIKSLSAPGMRHLMVMENPREIAAYFMEFMEASFSASTKRLEKHSASLSSKL